MSVRNQHAPVPQSESLHVLAGESLRALPLCLQNLDPSESLHALPLCLLQNLDPSESHHALLLSDELGDDIRDALQCDGPRDKLHGEQAPRPLRHHPRASARPAKDRKKKNTSEHITATEPNHSTQLIHKNRRADRCTDHFARKRPHLLLELLHVFFHPQSESLHPAPIRHTADDDTAARSSCHKCHMSHVTVSDFQTLCGFCVLIMCNVLVN